MTGFNKSETGWTLWPTNCAFFLQKHVSEKSITIGNCNLLTVLHHLDYDAFDRVKGVYFKLAKQIKISLALEAYEKGAEL